MYFRFEPYFRPMIWGNESWILSAYPTMESRVQGGLYAGKTLSELVEILGPSLMGHSLTEKYGNKFPLLIKIINAQDKLSIQVHPSDEQAQRQGKGSVGKTEMWYGLKSAPDAYLFSGLRNQLTPQTYAEHVANHSIVNDLAKYEPKEGDCFFLSPGRIHSIGAGCQLLEIQQTNDLTYRIYDYDRRDANGNPRELHTELAAECIDYNVLPDYQTHYEKRVNEEMTLAKCEYFETKGYRLIGDRRQATGDRREAERLIGDGRRATGDRRQATGDRREAERLIGAAASSLEAERLIGGNKTPDTRHQTLGGEAERQRGVVIDWSEEDRFLAVMITEGEGVLTIDGEEVSVKENDTLLLPATTQKIVATGTMMLVTTTAV